MLYLENPFEAPLSVIIAYHNGRDVRIFFVFITVSARERCNWVEYFCVRMPFEM